MAPTGSKGTLRVWQAVLIAVLLILAFVTLLYGCCGSQGDPLFNYYYNNDYNGQSNNQTLWTPEATTSAWV